MPIMHDDKKTIHEQAERLYEAAKALRDVTGQSAVAQLLNISPQNIYAWEKRGIARAAILEASKKLGCRPQWLETGEGEMLERSQPTMPSQIAFYVTQDEIEMLETYRALSSQEKKDKVRHAFNAMVQMMDLPNSSKN